MTDIVATSRMVAVTGTEAKDNKILSSGKLFLGNLFVRYVVSRRWFVVRFVRISVMKT